MRYVNLVLVKNTLKKLRKLLYLLQLFDMETETCIQDPDGFSKFAMNPIAQSGGLPLNVTSVPSSKFGLPKCTGDDQLIALKPYDGMNSEYKIVFDKTEEKELGLVITCPKLDPMPAGKDKYCLDHGVKQSKIESSIAVVCGKPTTCIRTCCPAGEYWSKGQRQCMKYENQPEKWRVQFTDDPNATYEEIFGHPCKVMIQQILEEHEVEFNSDGQIRLDMTNYKYTQYCLNNVEKGTEYTKELWVCDVEDQDGPLKSWQNAIDFTLVPILMGFSVGFLILLQGVIWAEKKERLYECMMLCNIWMMTLMYLTLIILKTTTLSGAICEILGILSHFAYMSAFFWLSAMSHFIWKAFKERPSLQKQRYGFAHPKFKGYALFAFGCPALVSIVTVILHHLPEEVQENFIAPRINNGTCQLGQAGDGLDIPKLWYFHLVNIMNLVTI